MFLCVELVKIIKKQDFLSYYLTQKTKAVLFA